MMRYMRRGRKSVCELEIATSSSGGGGGEILLEELPDDILALISSRLSLRDLCNLIASSRRLRAMCSSDKLWLPQCQRLLEQQLVDRPAPDLHAWRSGLQSFKALFRFLYGVLPMLGIWVHQNPELGNLVYVTWGFLSATGCRIIPQELGSRGLEPGLLWAPVFEIIAAPDGSMAFFLYGRDKDDCCYPGRVAPAKPDCNVLLLEAESILEPTPSSTTIFCSPDSPVSPLGGLLEQSSSDDGEEQLSTKKKAGTSNCRANKKGSLVPVNQQLISFGRLSFGDRRRLLELLVAHIRMKVPALAQGPTFPRSYSRKEVKTLGERHALLLWMYAHGDPCSTVSSSSSVVSHRQDRAVDSGLLLHKLFLLRSHLPTSRAIVATALRSGPTVARSNGFAQFVRTKMKQIMGGRRYPVTSPEDSCSSSGAEDKNRLQLEDYLKQSNAVGLRLHATTLKLTLYRAWPIISENRFALYKMLQQKPGPGREYAGLWGGTFGWPPGKPSEDKPGKALFFLLLSYDESGAGSTPLIATKILEGTHYVLHPNGSAMFTAKMDEPSAEVFPWSGCVSSFSSSSSSSKQVDIVAAFRGEGIANGYGFRYPGTKPGDLFVDASGMLVFVWKESKAVLAMERLDVETLLRRGERVAALPPIANFAYLTKANSNVFAGYSGGFAGHYGKLG